MIRVVLVEDNALLRDGLVRLFDEFDDIEVVDAVGDREAAATSVEAHEPTVVVTDIRMPPDHRDEGLQLAAWLTDHHPDIGVVVLSHHLEPDFAVRLLDRGSAGRAYLMKDRVGDASEVHRAVVAVADGGSSVDPAVIDALMESRRSGASDLDLLTVREAEVLEEMAAGASNRSIAESLGISERAVEKHGSSIFMKLGLSEETDVNRRVTAVLIYLGARGD